MREELKIIEAEQDGTSHPAQKSGVRSLLGEELDDDTLLALAEVHTDSRHAHHDVLL